MQLLVHGRRCSTVFAFKNCRGFLGDGLVTLAGQNVQHRLGADDLGSRGYQRDVAQVFTNLGNLVQYLVELVAGILLTQLVFHVGEHATRYLGNQDAGVGTTQAAFKLGVLLPYLTEVSGNFFQQVQVQAGITIGTLKNRNHGFGGRVTVGHAHGRNRGIHVVDTGFRGLDGGSGGHAGSGVALHVNRDVQLFLQTADQIKGHVRLENARHVFDRDGVRTHVGDFFRQLDPHVDGVNRARGVGNGALGVFAGLANSLDGAIQVTGIVHRIENTEHVHAILGGTLTETVNHIIRVMTVAQQILAAQKHLLLGVGHGFFQLANALPGIFAQVADAGIKGSAAPGLQGPETDLVEFLGNRQHVIQPHTGGKQGLVGVTQDNVRNPQRFLCVSHRVSLLFKGSSLLPAHFLWRDRNCAIAFLMASAVSGSTDAGAFGLARGVLAGVAGSGGANRPISLDMRSVANTRIIRNTNTNPIPAIIRSTACDIRSFISNSYLY